MKTKIFPAFVLAGCLVSEAAACSCGGESTVKSARTSASSVFLGIVVELSLENEWLEGPGSRERDCRVRMEWEGGSRMFCQGRLVTARFQVLKSWQGLKSDRAIVQTNFEESACGVGFRLGDVWLVYAHGEPDEVLTTSLCDRTRSESSAYEELPELGVPEHDYFVEMGSTP